MLISFQNLLYDKVISYGFEVKAKTAEFPTLILAKEKGRGEADWLSAFRNLFLIQFKSVLVMR